MLMRELSLHNILKKKLDNEEKHERIESNELSYDIDSMVVNWLHCEHMC